MGRCPDTWSPADQREYYGRLYDLIAEWLNPTIRLEDKFLDPKFDWFKVNIQGSPRSLNWLLDKGLIDERFVNNIIKNLYKNIQKHSSFTFDTTFSADNRRKFIETFTD